MPSDDPDARSHDEEEAPEQATNAPESGFDPDATLDAEVSEGGFDPDATLDADVSEGGFDPDATDIQEDLAVDTVSELETSLADGVDPDQTISVEAAVPEARGASDEQTLSVEQTVVLRQREVLRPDENDTPAPTGSKQDADYQIEQLLGEGGMGAVYAARQQSMGRPVAFKVLKPRGARLEKTKQAFVCEAIITGRLDHPNIVPIYDVGRQSDDSLFYAMKQVEGVEWKERIREYSLSENLEILLRVADAVAFGHSRSIIHRDLKPENIMLGAFGEVLVMDWGLAMPTADHPQKDAFPRPKRGGTPLYMAPEMAGDDLSLVDRRSDIYLLGAMLYEVATGKAPHVLDSPPANRRDHVKACLTAVLENRIADTSESGELIDIALKALATDRDDRYQTVSDFQSALREYIAHLESVELADRAWQRLETARASSSYEEFSRARFGFEAALEAWQSNSRAATGLKEATFDYASAAFERGDFDLALSLLDENDEHNASLLASVRDAIQERDSRQEHIRRLRRFGIGACIGIAVVAIIAAVWINSERHKALAAKQEESRQREIAEENEKEANEQRTAAVAAKALAEQREEEAQRNFRTAERNAYTSSMLLVQRSWQDARIGPFRALLEQSREKTHLRNFEWGYWDRVSSNWLIKADVHNAAVRCLAFTPDGTQLATAGLDTTIRILDTATGNELQVFEGHTLGVLGIAFSPDGKQLATGSDDQTAKLWDASTGNVTHTLEGHDGGVLGVAFNPDGSRVASASFDNTVKVWQSSDGQELLTLTGHERAVTSVTFTPDGNRIVTGSEDRTVRIWDAETGAETHALRGHDYWVHSVTVSPDGSLLASGSEDQTARIWDAKTGAEVRTLRGSTGPIYRVAFNEDGSLLATASGDSTLRVYETADWELVFTRKGHVDSIRDVVFSRDGTRLVTASEDKTVRFWNAAGDQLAVVMEGHTDEINCVAINHDGTSIASGGFDDILRVWDPLKGEQILALEGHFFGITGVAFSPDGAELASGSGDTTVKVWNLQTGQPVTLEGHEASVEAVAFSPDGQRLASAGSDQTVRIWNRNGWQQELSLQGHTGTASRITFNRAGDRIATAGDERTIRVWDATTGRELIQLSGETGQCVDFSPDGHRLVSSDGQNMVKVWDTESGDVILSLKGHSGEVRDALFSADGRRIFSASRDETVKVWDASTGQEIITLNGHTGEVYALAASSDGTRIVSTGGDRTIRIWDSQRWTGDDGIQSQTRTLLRSYRDRMPTLDDFRNTIQANPTISQAVRDLSEEWSTSFWENRQIPDQ